VPGLNDGFCPGLTIPGRKRLGVEEGALARHGVLPAQPRLEHFGCYSVKPVKPFKARTVKLRDQFGKSKTRVLRALTLCNPARKNKEAWRNRRAHLACYGVKRLTGFKKRRVLVRNQFGSAVLTLLRPSSLCLPSLKTRVKAKKPKPLAAAQRIDHFACYAVKPRKKLKSRLFTATDQFGRVRQRALKITNLCAPVSKNGGRIQHRVRHLVCYSRKRVGGKKFTLRQVRVRNQFGSKRWRVLRPVRFCVPSLKIKL